MTEATTAVIGVSSVLKDVTSVTGSVVGMLADNVVLAVFCGLGLVVAGAYAFKKLRKKAR